MVVATTAHLPPYTCRLQTNPPFPTEAPIHLHPNRSLLLPKPHATGPRYHLRSESAGGGSGNAGGGFINPWNGGGGGDDHGGEDEAEAFFGALFGYAARVISGWAFRWAVTGDPRFPGVLLMREAVGAPVLCLLCEGFGPQLRCAAAAVLEGLAAVLLLPFFAVFLPFFIGAAVADAFAAAGIACLCLSAVAAALFATSFFGKDF